MVDIVDMDDESFEDVVSHEFAVKLADSTGYRLFMTLIIIVNSILIGCETSFSFVYSIDAVFCTNFMCVV